MSQGRPTSQNSNGNHILSQDDLKQSNPAILQVAGDPVYGQTRQNDKEQGKNAEGHCYFIKAIKLIMFLIFFPLLLTTMILIPIILFPLVIVYGVTGCTFEFIASQEKIWKGFFYFIFLPFTMFIGLKIAITQTYCEKIPKVEEQLYGCIKSQLIGICE